jgi:hypothetical protein
LWDKGLSDRFGEAPVPDDGMTPRESDQFKRIKITADIERFREIIVKYQEGMAEYRSLIEDGLYEIGGIDERLGD